LSAACLSGVGYSRKLSEAFANDIKP
jgi:hypothetical protein